MTRAVVMFAVPSGTPTARCRSCNAVIHWIVTSAGRRMPVDVSVEGGAVPTATTDGRGVSHFATCPHADQHRKPR